MKFYFYMATIFVGICLNNKTFLVPEGLAHRGFRTNFQLSRYKLYFAVEVHLKC